MTIKSQTRVHGGDLLYVTHESVVTHCTMTYSIFLPKESKAKACPALIFLSGLTCTEANFTTKAGAYKKAAELGMIIIAPDTSPRGESVPNDEAYDLGQGASFYIDATQAPWVDNFQMESYIVTELRSHILETYNVDEKKIGITGHSMGGHGALTLYLKYPELFSSVSAFAPICSPTTCDWGKKAFSAYFGEENEANWNKHDATELMKQHRPDKGVKILIDQGLEDNFLGQKQLQPELFKEACESVNQPLELRLHEGYDHSYFFIQSFIDDHLVHHFS